MCMIVIVLPPIQIVALPADPGNVDCDVGRLRGPASRPGERSGTDYVTGYTGTAVPEAVGKTGDLGFGFGCCRELYRWSC